MGSEIRLPCPYWVTRARQHRSILPYTGPAAPLHPALLDHTGPAAPLHPALLGHTGPAAPLHPTPHRPGSTAPSCPTPARQHRSYWVTPARQHRSIREGRAQCVYVSRMTSGGASGGQQDSDLRKGMVSYCHLVDTLLRDQETLPNFKAIVAYTLCLPLPSCQAV